jgi:FkbM family methyltransferase
MYFDIGANIGKWSLANVNKCEKIVAVEASPDTFKTLSENMKNNKIICMNFAVCDSKEEYVSFYESGANTISTLNKDWLVSEKSRFYNYSKMKEISCKPITIDKLIEIHGMPTLIKVDVEGGEFECLSSLTQKVDNLCFEWASELKDIAFKCMDYLEQLGFKEFHIQLEDNYTFRPTLYTNKQSIIDYLNTTTPKKEWGMIWAK